MRSCPSSLVACSPAGASSNQIKTSFIGPCNRYFCDHSCLAGTDQHEKDKNKSALWRPCDPPPAGLWMLLCKCADVAYSSLAPNLFAFSPVPDFRRPAILLRIFSFPPRPALFLPVPHAQPGSSALMHHGTFCSSESQCDQPLRGDRTATSLGNTAHRRSSVPGPVWGQGRRRRVGARVEDEEAEEGRVPATDGYNHVSRQWDKWTRSRAGSRTF